jgi:hypothetical protein
MWPFKKIKWIKNPIVSDNDVLVSNNTLFCTQSQFKQIESNADSVTTKKISASLYKQI